VPVGELAALATASCWAVTSLVFAEAARRIGALRVNLLRLPVALALLSLALLGADQPLAQLTWLHFGFLAGSAAVGLLLGDLAYFAALGRLGARLSSLLMSLAPVFATLAGRLLLGEALGTRAALGVAVTLTGVAWVAAEQGPRGEKEESRLAGISLGVVAAACQGVGLVLAKLGMAGEVAPLPATWIRIGVATVLLWLLTAASGRLGGEEMVAATRRAWRPVVAGAFFGPFLGVWLSLTAAALTHVGVAATLMATTPVLVIPLVVALERYRPTVRAVLGTLVAVAGVALLFTRG